MDYEKNGGRVETWLDLFLDKIKITSNFFAIILLTGLGLLLCASIAMRYFLGQPISWANAVARYVYIYIVLIGTAISYLEGGHAVIESMYNTMPRIVKIIFDLLHYIIIMGVTAMLVVTGTKYAIGMWDVHSPVLTSFSMGVIYLSVPISALIIFIYLLRKTIGLRREYRQ